MDYRTLAWTEDQWPEVGGEDQYYGGTSYANKSGLGQRWAAAAETETIPAFELPEITKPEVEGLSLVAVPSLYDTSLIMAKSRVIDARIEAPTLYLRSDEALNLGIASGDDITLSYNSTDISAKAVVTDDTPQGVALVRGLPRTSGPVSLCLPIKSVA